MKNSISHQILKSYLIYCIPVYFLVERPFANRGFQAFEVIQFVSSFPDYGTWFIYEYHNSF
jgi:hypothetical protein